MSGEKKAHFQKVKEENKRLIRNLLLKKEGLGISNLARESELSYPTVASLISELMKEGQVNILEEAESCGGRPGLRYALNPEYRQGLVLVLMAEGLHGVVYDACGKVIKEYRREVSSDLTAEQLVAEIAGIQAENSNLTDIALGIPGAVHEHEITHLPRFPHLLGSELAERIKGKTKASFCLENDLNAIVLTEVNEYRDFAHIAWIEGCIGVGIGAVGAVVPMLPAFPFLLLAAFSFARSSERLHTWFVNTKLYKDNLADYVAGRGMTVKTKVRIMITVTLLMSIGFIMMGLKGIVTGCIVLGCVWAFHIVYFIWGVKTIPATKEPVAI